MSFISLGKLDKNIIPIILGSIVCFLNRLLNTFTGTKLFKNTILTNICISSSKLFAVIPLIIFKMRSKSSKKTITQNSPNLNITQTNNSLEYIYNDDDKEKEIRKGTWKFIFMSGIIFTINQFLYVLTCRIKSDTYILLILAIAVFYYIFLKIKLYRHHYLSIILIIITGLIMDFVLENLNYDITNNLWLLIIRVIREIIYSLTTVIDKYIMEKKLVSAYQILLCDGIITVIIFIIFAIFDYYFIGYFDKYDDYFTNFNNIELIVIFGVLITQFFLNLFLLVTIKVNSPCHIFIIYVLGQFAYYIDFSKKAIIVSCCLILILFFSFIFNEMIEINFFGLSFNTKRNIIARAENEGKEESNMTRLNSLDSGSGSNCEDEIALIEMDDTSNK